MLARPVSRLAYVALVVALAVPALARATEEANLKLPPNAYGCQVCHGAGEVTPLAVPENAIVPLTPLGLEWRSQSLRESERLWSDLALANVDGDGCSTGFELGDPSGVYVPDGTPASDQSVSDPNQADCTLPISEDSWSRLKSLFDDN